MASPPRKNHPVNGFSEQRPKLPYALNLIPLETFLLSAGARWQVVGQRPTDEVEILPSVRRMTPTPRHPELAPICDQLPNRFSVRTASAVKDSQNTDRSLSRAPVSPFPLPTRRRLFREGTTRRKGSLPLLIHSDPYDMLFSEVARIYD